MISYRVTSFTFGFFVGCVIFYLVRRGHLHIMHSAWWFLVGLTCIAVGTFPGLIDWFATILGIHYPPNLILAAGICFFLIKLLHIDIHRSEQEMRIQTLTERIAFLEMKLNNLSETNE
ncbi:conserved hypothetical protein, membrane [Candidatus Magnetomorum sp. HK-1]|nr:conserved hypothetical protein, membrane [Candidatus Magnetomorum sp. HK-1]